MQLNRPSMIGLSALVLSGLAAAQTPMLPYGYPMLPQGYAIPLQQPLQQPMLMPFFPILPAVQPYAPAQPVGAPSTPPATVQATAPGPGATAQVPAPNPAFTFPGMPNVTLQGLMPLFQQMQPAPANLPPYTMRRVITQEDKKQMVQAVLPMMTGFMQMAMPDVMNFFAHKYKVKKGVTFDDVVESMKLSANKQNLKLVGENLMWKDFRAVLGDQDGPRMEVYSFCDIAVGRELLKVSPEFIVFLPCRIAVMEDANKEIWVLMLDWNPEWVAGYKEKLGLPDPLWDGAIQIRKKLDNVMQAGANGDL